MNIKTYSRVLLFSVCCFFVIDLSAQPFATALKKLQAEYPQEKLYLHYDKEVYYPGETIWFKAYLFSGNFPSEISKVLYADLLDAKGKVLQHKILPVIQSSSPSSFVLPADLNGLVYVRCYTKWMLNFDTALLYQKDFYISKLKQNARGLQSTTGTSPLYRVEFFPESGALVEDVESRIAFKATDQSGNPVSISGTVSNNTDQSVVLFQTSHDGMGSFKLTPLMNTTYTATCAQGTKQMTIELPVPQKTGVVLEISKVDDAIIYMIKRPEGKPISPFVYIVGQMNQQLVYQAKVPIDKEEFTSGRVDIAGLPSGVLQFTVFTSEEKPIAERLVFVHLKQSSFSVNVNSILYDSTQRSKNTIEIEVPDSISSNLSVSVTSGNVLTDPNSESIYTDLLLGADLKEYLPDPGFYFSQHDSASFYLDLVMMTSRWRRFKWKEVLSGRFTNIKYKPETSLTVNGEIKGLTQKELQQKDLIGVFQLKSGGKYFLNTAISQDRNFSFSNLSFYDSAKLYYQLNNDKKGDLSRKVKFTTFKQVLEEGVRMPLRKSNTLNLISIPDNNPGYQLYQANQKHLDSLKVKTLSGVTVTASIRSKKDSLNDEYTSGAFVSQSNSRTIVPEDEPAFLTSQNLFDFLRGRFPGLEVNPDTDENPVSKRSFATSLFVNEISQQIVTPGGALIEDGAYMRSLSMSDIAMVKIFNQPFVGVSGNGRGGVLAVYTKRGGAQIPAIAKAFEIVRGYSTPQEFYGPDHSKDSSGFEPDYRNTLYWNPYIMTDKDHRKVSCSFYTNDLPGTIKVVVEGCNYEGRLIRIEQFLKTDSFK